MMNQNNFEPNHNYNSNYDQPPQYHQPPRIQENLFQEKMNDFLTMMQSFCEKLLQEQHAANIDQRPLQELSLKEMEDLKQHYLDEMLSQDPEDILIIRNEELNTVLEKESDEFIKSSVEDLVLIPSESEDTSGSDSECILPSCDDFSPIDVPKEKFVTFSNPLFNSNDDFISSDDESPSDEDVLEDNGGDDDEINVLDCEDSYYDFEGDILYLESLLNDDLVHHDPFIPALSVASILEGFTDESPLEENDELFNLEPKNDDWKKILYGTPILMTADKVFDPGIHDQNFSPTYVSLPFKDRHYLFFTYVIRILLFYFTYLLESPFLLSFESEDTIFDLRISVFHFSHRSETFC
nr:hypothetical protein [Tanacetum cinerariifolium]